MAIRVRRVSSKRSVRTEDMVSTLRHTGHKSRVSDEGLRSLRRKRSLRSLEESEEQEPRTRGTFVYFACEFAACQHVLACELLPCCMSRGTSGSLRVGGCTGVNTASTTRLEAFSLQLVRLDEGPSASRCASKLEACSNAAALSNSSCCVEAFSFERPLAFQEEALSF